MAMELASNQHAVGDNLYYFDCGDPKVDWCLVLAHGCYSHDTPLFTVPEGKHLYFYCGHDTYAQDPSIEDLISRNPSNQPVYHLSEGKKSWDYSLAKVLGRHNRRAISQ